ncbi:MAG: FtsQ-type POTRA domain-containing protein [Opitutales bacterium]|nr:FtsQ-type POTRA domain-containing protein [Opitutales bacterium]
MREESQSWQDLTPSSKSSGKASWRARLKAVFTWIKRAFFVCAIAAAAFGGYYAYKNGIVEKLLTPSTGELRGAIFKTDGVITEQWARENSLMPEPQNLAQIDVMQIREKFLGVSQIKDASVAKIYPDKILIEISEYKPAARIAIARNKIAREYIVSREGVIYDPVCVPPESVADLPWIMGVPIIMKGDGFEKCDNAETIDELITSARAALPENFATWRTINARELGSRTLPIMIVSTTENVKIIFRSENIKYQLEKLEYILRYFEEEGLGNVEKIDLSLKDKAIVSLRKKNER